MHTKLDALKSTSNKEVHQAPSKVVKPKFVIDENPRNVEEITVTREKREEIFIKQNRIKTSIIKKETIKYLRY